MSNMSFSTGVHGSGRYGADGHRFSARSDHGPQTQAGLINPADGSAALAGGTPGGRRFLATRSASGGKADIRKCGGNVG